MMHRKNQLAEIDATIAQMEADAQRVLDNEQLRAAVATLQHIIKRESAAAAWWVFRKINDELLDALPEGDTDVDLVRKRRRLSKRAPS